MADDKDLSVTVADPEPDEQQKLAKRGRGPITALSKSATMAQAFTGLMPSTLGEAVILAGHLARSLAIPKGLQNKPDTVLTIILAGLEIGLTPIRAIQSITNISGTLCMKADLQLALVQRSGQVSFYDEGFEEKGKTDTTLGKRIRLSLAAQKVTDDQIELIVAKIAAAAEGLAPGKPYGWAMGIRTGTTQVHVRTFTYADAERAVIYEASEDGPKEKKPLSEKFNYTSFPGDMYPKRARTRLVAVLASDVTAGLPAAEAIEGGQVIEGEVVAPAQVGDDADEHLAAIRLQDADLAKRIEDGFSHLQMGPAKQLQLLVRFRDDANQLLEFLRTEVAKRAGQESVKPGKAGKKKGAGHPVEQPAKLAEQPAKPAGEPTKQPVTDAVSTQEVKPVAPVVEAQTPVGKKAEPAPVEQAKIPEHPAQIDRLKSAVAAMKRVSF